MKNTLYLCLAFCFFSFFGCRQNATSEIENLKSQLKAASAEIQKLKSEAADKKQLIHIVWFKMKPEADKSELIAKIKKLEAIEVLNDLEVGKFQDLGDARAMSDLDLVMQMGFDSEEDYKIYQAHPIHLDLKKAVGVFLSGPPVTYDFWTE